VDALTYISRAMRNIGALDTGEVPSADEAADFLVTLNGMIDAWRADRLFAFSIVIEEFPLIAGQQVYTMGPGGNFNTARPVKIDRVSIVWLSNPQQPLELPIPYLTDRDWQNVPVKNIQTSLPTMVYDDGNFPLRNLSYWGIPSQLVNTRIYSWQQLLAFPDLQTDITMPPGYQEAVQYSLAERLIGEIPGNYSQVMTTTTAELGANARALVKTMNAPTIEAFCDIALLGRSGYYDWRSDSIVGGPPQ